MIIETTSEKWRVVSSFYKGTFPQTEQFIEDICGGYFLLQEIDEALEQLNFLAKKSRAWDFPIL